MVAYAVVPTTASAAMQSGPVVCGCVCCVLFLAGGRPRSAPGLSVLSSLLPLRLGSNVVLGIERGSGY